MAHSTTYFMKNIFAVFFLFYLTTTSFGQQKVWEYSGGSYQIWETATVNDKLFYFIENAPSGLVAIDEQSNSPFFQKFDFIGTFKVLNNKVFFNAAIGDNNNVWMTDGTAAGTVQVTFFDNFNIGSLTVFDEKLYFSNASQVWFTDGTIDGTKKVLEVSPMQDIISNMVVLNNKLFYYYSGQLGVTDGISSTVHFLSDESTSDIINNIETELMVLNNKLFFIHRTDTTGRELWCTDGTDENTAQFIDIRPGVEDAFEVPYQSTGPDPWFTASNGKFYFIANKGTGKSVWVTDGTVSGTSELYIGSDGVIPDWLISIDGNVYFSNNYSYGFYFSDGKNNTVYNISGTANPYDAYSFIKYNDSVYFVAYDTDHGYELWKTGNTPESTMRVTDICPGTCSAFNHYTGLATCGNTLFFSASDTLDPEYGSDYQLWKLTTNTTPTAIIKSSTPVTKAYPNPCEDFIAIEIPSQPSNVTIVSSVGIADKALWKYENNQVIVNTQSYVSGMYKVVIDGYEPVSVIKK